MDVPVTLLTVFVVYGVVKWLDSVVSKLGTTSAGIYSVLKVPLAIGIGIGVAVVMAQTDFAKAQEFFGMQLGLMNTWSQVMVGVTLGFGAAGIAWVGNDVIPQIGQNKP